MAHSISRVSGVRRLRRPWGPGLPASRSTPVERACVATHASLTNPMLISRNGNTFPHRTCDILRNIIAFTFCSFHHQLQWRRPIAYSSSFKEAELSLDIGRAAIQTKNRGSAETSAEPRLQSTVSGVLIPFRPRDGRSLTFRRSDRSIGGTVRRLGSSSARTRCSARSVTQGAASTLFWCRPCRHSLP